MIYLESSKEFEGLAGMNFKIGIHTIFYPLWKVRQPLSLAFHFKGKEGDA